VRPEVPFSFSPSLAAPAEFRDNPHDRNQDDALWVSQNDLAGTWGGSPASRAWRLLRTHLARHDTPPFPYTHVVLVRALAVGGTGRDGLALPTWLVDWFRARDPDALGRELVRFERVDEALELGLGLVTGSPVTPKEASTSLPYGLVDQLLALDAPSLRPKQAELRRLVEDRFGALEKADRVLTKRARA